MALRTLKPRLQVLRPTAARPIGEIARMRGRKLQDRRLRMWSKNPHCALCGRLTQYPGGFELDHVVALANGGQDTEDNCQILCCGADGCHNIKTGRDLHHEGRKAARFPEWIGPAAGRLTIVFGAPGSGKSTWVKKNAGPHDITIDVDEIIVRLSGQPLYHGTSDWMESALLVRNKMLTGLRNDTRDAYLITTGGTEAHRNWWQAKMRPAQVVVMTTSLQACIDRINADDRRPSGAKVRAIAGAEDWHRSNNTRKLQDRRLRMWSKDPHCANCGRLTQYPDGFELDHITPLFMGGQDVEANCQILCSWIDEYGQRQGCHVAKSNEERE